MSLNTHVLDDGGEDASLRTPLTADYNAAEAGQPSAPYPPPHPEPQSNEKSPQSKYRDPAFAVLFIAQWLVVFGFALGRGIPALLNGGVEEVEVDPVSQGAQDTNEENSPLPLLLGLGLVMVLGGLLSGVWVKVLLRFGEGLIRCTLLSSVALFLLSGAGFIVAGSIGGGIALLLVGALNYLYYRLVTDRIAFAAKNLKVGCTAVADMPGTVTVSLCFLVLQVVWCLIWGVALVGTATNYSKNSITGPDGISYPLDSCKTYETDGPSPGFSATCTQLATCYKCVCDGQTVFADQACASYSVNGGLYFLLLLSLYWGCTVVAYIVHTTTAGAVAAWWFTNDKGKAPVYASLGRAVTSSFGSICLAALLVAGVRVLRLILNSMKERRRSMSEFLLCIVECLLGVFERILEYVNRYALCYVAIYGSTFLAAGRETYELFRRRGFTTVINDQLIDNALALGGAVVGVVCALGGFVIGRLMFMNNVNTLLLVLFGLFAGFFLASVTTAVISSAVATVFVAFAQDHRILQSTHPDLHLELMQAWHKFHAPLMVQAGYTM